MSCRGGPGALLTYGSISAALINIDCGSVSPTSPHSLEWGRGLAPRPVSGLRHSRRADLRHQAFSVAYGTEDRRVM